MSANDTTNTGQRPVLVVDVHELREYLREVEGQSQDQQGGYSEHFAWQKTDLALNVDQGVSVSRAIMSGNVRAVCGWALTEATGAATASIRLHDGNGITGEQFGRINLQANESVRDYFAPHGIRCSTGRVFCEVLSGQVEGVLYWR